MEPSPKDPPSPPSSPNDDSPPELDCAVCFRQFDNIFNTPKMLQCHHTFCLECLARMNVISSQPDSLQCPLCRAYTPLPTLGLPKLDTDPSVLSYLPEAMQHVYSIRFNRDRGKLQVKRVPSSAPPPSANTRHSLDLGLPADAAEAEGEGQVTRGRFVRVVLRVAKMPICRLLFMALGMLIMVALTVAIVILTVKK